MVSAIQTFLPHLATQMKSPPDWTTAQGHRTFSSRPRTVATMTGCAHGCEKSTRFGRASHILFRRLLQLTSCWFYNSATTCTGSMVPAVHRLLITACLKVLKLF